jgi:hypothetical protein
MPVQQTEMQPSVKTVFDGNVKMITLDELKEMKMKPGEKVNVMSSKGSEYYTITMPKKEGALPYCSCAAWKYQRLSPALRTCKHTSVLL